MVSPTYLAARTTFRWRNEYVDTGVSGYNTPETGYSPMTAQPYHNIFAADNV